jgi:hypothetical protein
LLTSVLQSKDPQAGTSLFHDDEGDDFFASKAIKAEDGDEEDNVNHNHTGFKRRVAGGRTAVSKKISADMDSEDEMIMEMREKGVSDKDIAEALTEDGRTNYNSKTIQSRYVRLKAALAAKRDELLDGDLTDWHEGEVRHFIHQFNS